MASTDVSSSTLSPPYFVMKSGLSSSSIELRFNLAPFRCVLFFLQLPLPMISCSIAHFPFPCSFLASFFIPLYPITRVFKGLVFSRLSFFLRTPLSFQPFSTLHFSPIPQPFTSFLSFLSRHRNRRQTRRKFIFQSSARWGAMVNEAELETWMLAAPLYWVLRRVSGVCFYCVFDLHHSSYA